MYVCLFGFRANPLDQFKFWLATISDEDAASTYAIIPRSWIISDEECYYPKTKRSVCNMEQLVKDNLPPGRKKDFKTLKVKFLLGCGMY